MTKTLKRLVLEKKFYNFIFFLLVLQSLLYTASAEKYFNKFLSRFLQGSNQRCMAEIDPDTLIGHYSHKILDFSPFNMNTTDTMTLDCFYNQTCIVNQQITIGQFEYSPSSFNFTAENLPQAWKCYGTAQVLLLDNLDELADAFIDLVKSATDIYHDIIMFKADFVAEIDQFLIDFNNSMSGLNNQVIEEIKVQLNSTSSDLALEFEQILVNAFNIFSAQNLQQVVNDFLFFSNQLQNIVQVVQNEIKSNEGKLATANSSVILNYIQILSQNYTILGQQFTAEFSKYQQLEDNYTSIINDLLQTQIVNKFNFSDANATTTVQNFLINIIQTKRNLINETNTQFAAQFEKYQSNLNSSIVHETKILNTSLEQLKAFIIANDNATNSNMSVDSIFTNLSEIEALLAWNYTINPLQTLTELATVAFANALNQFQVDFTILVINLEQSLNVTNTTNTTFSNYSVLVAKAANFTHGIVAYNHQKIQKIWLDSIIIKNLMSTTIQNIINTEYVMTPLEQQKFSQFNLWASNVSIPSVYIKFLNLKQAIPQIIANLSQEINLSEQLTLNFTGLNETIITNAIIQNLINLTSQITLGNIISKINLNQFLYQVESFLGIANTTNSSEIPMNSSVNVTKFLEDVEPIALKDISQGIEIFKAIIMNNYTNLTNFNSSEANALESRFGDCFIDINNFTGLPATFEENKTYVVLNLSLQTIENYMSLEFSFTGSLNGTYGAVANDTVGAFFFELDPNLSISVEILKNTKEASFLQYNATTDVNGSVNLTNVLILGMRGITNETIVDGNLIDMELGESFLHIVTTQQFMNLTTNQTCNNMTNVCQNITTYGWGDVIMNEENLSVPAEHLSLTLGSILNVTNLLN